MNRLVLALTLGSAFHFSSQTAHVRAEPTKIEDDNVIARVNGEQVSLEAVERSLTRTHTTGVGDRPASADVDRLLFRVINDVLIAQEARAMGLDEEPPMPETVADFRRQRAVQQLERDEIWRQAMPTDEEVRMVFEDQYRRATFRVMTAYEKAEAMEMLQELEKGESFLELVETRSVDPYRVREGLVDNIARIDLQRGIGELVFSLQPGEIGGPVQTDLGWSLVLLESQQPADPARFAEVEATVRALVRQQKARARRSSLAASLREKHGVEVDREVVSSVQPQRHNDGRLLPSTPEPDATAVRIGEEMKVSAQDYADALTARWKGVRNEEAALAAAPIVLDRLIEAKIVEAEALARGLDRSKETERAALAYENELLLNRYLEEVVAAGITVSPEEMQEHYDKNRQTFHRPPRIRLGQITLASEAEAEEVANLLRQGTDLAWLAKQRSLDRFSQDGGDRGWQVPQPGAQGLNQALLEASVGEILEPTGEGENWVVIKVLDRQEQGVYSFEEISGNIRQAVFSEKLLQAIDRLVQTLRERSEIEIREEALNRLQITGTDELESARNSGGDHVH